MFNLLNFCSESHLSRSHSFLITCAASVLKVYSVKTGEVVKTLRHKSRVTGFFFNPANALQVPSCSKSKQQFGVCFCRLVEPLNTFGGSSSTRRQRRASSACGTLKTACSSRYAAFDFALFGFMLRRGGAQVVSAC